MFGFIGSLIKFVFNSFILSWVVIALLALSIPVKMYFCESHLLNNLCIDDTNKFIQANRQNEQKALDIEHRDQARKIKAMQAKALAELNTSATANRVQLLNESLNRQSTMTKEQYLNADGLNQGKYQTDRTAIEAHYQEELSQLDTQLQKKQDQLNKKYQQDTVTLYNQLKASIPNN